ncbi:MAG: DoxX family protein [Candidatus Hydrogenedentes bacterium]|nr:DoxX family protein [Candidatus Hydrogenedentota bacterium]
MATAKSTGESTQRSAPLTLMVTLLRVLIGWHFLYEGVVKLAAEKWSAGSYLASSRGFLSGFYHWLASDPTILRVTDLMNMWGLTLIGVALILGLFTRTASLFGALLLGFYYMAYPPFAGLDFGAPSEGHYLLVNKTLVEMVALLALASIRPGIQLGLDRIVRLIVSKLRRSSGTDSASAESAPLSTRREVLAGLATAPVLGAFALTYNRQKEQEAIDAISGATIVLRDTNLAQLKGALPKGEIRGMKLSRLILGNNLIGGWSHSRDLIYVSELFKAYNNDRKVFETLMLAEKAGIDTMVVVNAQFPLFNRYKRIMGGKLQTICQVFPKEDDLFTDADKAIDYGVTTPYFQGAVSDRFVQNGMVDKIGEVVEHIRKQGYPAGIGAHSIQVPIACQKAGIIPDYYVKTCHHDQYWSATPRENRQEFTVDRAWSPDHNLPHDNMFDVFPEQTIEVMKSIEVPWIAFKVLAGGAIHPKDGFNYAFKNGADFLCVGMFDFQIVDDVNIAIDTLRQCQVRERRWMA